MLTTSITHIAHLVDLCFQYGVRNVVLSPGSRNAPLIIAFDEHPEIKTWLIHDERSAAFFALGMIDSLNEPVAIACTSGSAPLNYAPAISEAYYRNKPLIVLTADRPLALIDQGDGQTIRQKNVFENFVKGSFELPDFSIQTDLNLSDQICNQALNVAIQTPQAPVHINIPLSEPLYGVKNQESEPYFSKQEEKKKSLLPEDQAFIEKIWNESSKKLILIGQNTPDLKLQLSLLPLLNLSDVAVLVENTSNFQHFTKAVHCIDRTLAVIHEDELQDFAPDLLITIGGAIISKKIKTYFRRHKARHTWRIGNYLFEEDTFQSLTKSWQVDPADFFEILARFEYSPETNFGDKWKQKDFIAQAGHDTFLTQLDWCDLKAFELILDSIPGEFNLHMGNSSVVRYCQLFNPIPNVQYYGNRGVSGIDGSTSTAVGFAASQPEKQNLLISGDISFLYDSNALWNHYLSSNLKMIVINNGGGGIFQILDGSNTVKQAPYFFSPYQANLADLCRTFGVNYAEAGNPSELETGLFQLLTQRDSGPSLLEIKTFNQDNAAQLRSYFNLLGKEQ